ncbi:hypothetical protein LY78DRAFT_283383 [Colletotrichum sublineola]|nr:hypothetical protein LY78DRAFT_283383 [Colletotrichum sublineola]
MWMRTQMVICLGLALWNSEKTASIVGRSVYVVCRWPINIQSWPWKPPRRGGMTTSPLPACLPLPQQHTLIDTFPRREGALRDCFASTSSGYQRQCKSDSAFLYAVLPIISAGSSQDDDGWDGYAGAQSSEYEGCELPALPSGR